MVLVLLPNVVQLSLSFESEIIVEKRTLPESLVFGEWFSSGGSRRTVGPLSIIWVGTFIRLGLSQHQVKKVEKVFGAVMALSIFRIGISSVVLEGVNEVGGDFIN